MKSNSKNNFFRKKQQQQQLAKSETPLPDVPSHDQSTPLAAAQPAAATSSTKKPTLSAPAPDINGPVRKRGRPPLAKKAQITPVLPSTTVVHASESALSTVPLQPSEPEVDEDDIADALLPRIPETSQSNEVFESDAPVQDSQDHGMATVSIVSVDVTDFDGETDGYAQEETNPLLEAEQNPNTATSSPFDDDDNTEPVNDPPVDNDEHYIEKPLNMPISPRSPRLRRLQNVENSELQDRLAPVQFSLVNHEAESVQFLPAPVLDSETGSLESEQHLSVEEAPDLVSGVVDSFPMDDDDRQSEDSRNVRNNDGRASPEPQLSELSETDSFGPLSALTDAVVSGLTENVDSADHVDDDISNVPASLFILPTASNSLAILTTTPTYSHQDVDLGPQLLFSTIIPALVSQDAAPFHAKPTLVIEDADETHETESKTLSKRMNSGGETEEKRIPQKPTLSFDNTDERAQPTLVENIQTQTVSYNGNDTQTAIRVPDACEEVLSTKPSRDCSLLDSVRSPRSPRVKSSRGIMSPRIVHNVREETTDSREPLRPVFFQNTSDVDVGATTLSNLSTAAVPSASADVVLHIADDVVQQQQMQQTISTPTTTQQLAAAAAAGSTSSNEIFRQILLQAKQQVDEKLQFLRQQLVEEEERRRATSVSPMSPVLPKSPSVSLQSKLRNEQQTSGLQNVEELDDLKLSELATQAVLSARATQPQTTCEMNALQAKPPTTIAVHEPQPTEQARQASSADVGEREAGVEAEDAGEHCSDSESDDIDDNIHTVTDEEYWSYFEHTSFIEMNEYDKALLLRYRIASILDSESPVHLLMCPMTDDEGHFPGSLISRRKLVDWWIAGIMMSRGDGAASGDTKFVNSATMPTPHMQQRSGASTDVSALSPTIAEIVRAGNIPLTVHAATERELFVSLYGVNKLRKWSPCFAYTYGGVFTRNNGAPKCVAFEAPISGRSLRDLIPSLIASDLQETIAWVYDALLLAFEKITFSHGNLDVDHVYMCRMPGIAVTSYVPTIVGYEQAGFVVEHEEYFVGFHSNDMAAASAADASHVRNVRSVNPIAFERHGPVGDVLSDIMDLTESIRETLDPEMQKDSVERISALIEQLENVRRKSAGDISSVLRRLQKWRESLRVEPLTSVTSIGGVFRVQQRTDIDTGTKWRLQTESEVEDLYRTTSETTGALLKRQFSSVYTYVGNLATICQSIPWGMLTKIAARLKPLPGEAKRKTRAQIVAIELQRRLDMYRANGVSERIKEITDCLRRYLPGQSSSQSASMGQPTRRNHP